MASNVAAVGDAFEFRAPTEKSLILFIAIAGSRPLKMRGIDGPRATASKGDFGDECGRLRSERFSHPSSVDFMPGVPDSMKSCASEGGRLGAGDPPACPTAR